MPCKLRERCKIGFTLQLIEVIHISKISACCPLSSQYFFQIATRLEQGFIECLVYAHDSTRHYTEHSHSIKTWAPPIPTGTTHHPMVRSCFFQDTPGAFT